MKFTNSLQDELEKVMPWYITTSKEGGAVHRKEVLSVGRYLKDKKYIRMAIYERS